MNTDIRHDKEPNRIHWVLALFFDIVFLAIIGYILYAIVILLCWIARSIKTLEFNIPILLFLSVDKYMEFLSNMHALCFHEDHEEIESLPPTAEPLTTECDVHTHIKLIKEGKEICPVCKCEMLD